MNREAKRLEPKLTTETTRMTGKKSNAWRAGEMIESGDLALSPVFDSS